jgi:hypothetical protein
LLIDSTNNMFKTNEIWFFHVQVPTCIT